MPRYAYHDLFPQQFERTVVEICQHILGIGVQEFADGPDGGRDAKFCGTAQRFPSTENPWSGKFIIQAKHTTNPIAKFSDPEFSSNASSSVLSKELPRIKRLKESNELDYYLLFSNRRQGADANQAIVKRIADEADVQDAHLIGIEGLERYVKNTPGSIDYLRAVELDRPLRVSPDELANVILAIRRSGVIQELSPSKLEFSPSKLERTRFDDKNRINGLSKEFARDITRKHLSNFKSVKDFLANPANGAPREQYQIAAEELQVKIIEHRRSYGTFDQMLNYLIDRLFERDGDLAGNKPLTRTVVYYMYWNCDIGTEGREEA